ncbi:hypothetical protein SmJEL517_g04372 [Synchytrium microbalum]|uniref:DUF676 domain-containing protein n=1 Tax=Synchytrium microbalum TaxID=1806994 RepID=A0A507BYQ9_9FUNG|nr:uncharacterized protein SmJEL517_g04372 [Synchytrium microbalum]TPX32562.1 hypothetical protein SmJEL517_g04372 [Synchytrium microbalum]
MTTNEHKEIHLVVCQHGLWGVPTHFNVLLKHMEDVHGDTEVRILNSNISQGFQTYAGIDLIGDKLIELIHETIATMKKKDQTVTRISFIGYSLGGLVMRYTIGKLYTTHFFDTIQPINFVTIATPHLGIRKKGNQTIEKIFNSLASALTSRSGSQMALEDVYLNGLPLLVVMAMPNSPFYKALGLFKRRQAFANIKSDRTVPYTTASFKESNPYHRWVPMKGYGDEYPSLVKPSTVPYTQLPMTTRGKVTFSIFIILSPILVPLWLAVALPTLAGWSAYYHITTKPTETEWVWSDKDLQFHASSNPELLKTSAPAQRAYIIEQLNTLPWDKVDVMTERSHSHAAIIVRNGKDGSYDVTKYLVDTFARI